MNVPDLERYVEKICTWDDVFEVKIVLKDFEEVQITGELQHNCWTISISDYFARMPDRDAKQMMKMYLRLCNDNNYQIEYNKIPYIYTRQIAVDNQDIYIERARTGEILTKGDVHDLGSMANDLVRRGMVDPGVLDGTIITYVDDMDEDISGHASTFFRLVCIDYNLDQVELPDFFVESVLMHELLHVEIGFSTLYDPHGKEFQRRMKRFDRKEELLQWGREYSTEEEFQKDYADFL